MLFLSKCWRVDERMYRLLDGEMTETEASALHAHIAECQRCSHLWEVVQVQVELERRLRRRKIRVSADFNERVLRAIREWQEWDEDRPLGQGGTSKTPTRSGMSRREALRNGLGCIVASIAAAFTRRRGGAEEVAVRADLEPSPEEVGAFLAAVKGLGDNGGSQRSEVLTRALALLGEGRTLEALGVGAEVCFQQGWGARVVLGEPNEEAGLEQIEHDGGDGRDGVSKVVSASGKQSRSTSVATGNCYLYFRLARPHEVGGGSRRFVLVEYYDAPKGWFGLEYDSTDPGARFEGAYKRSRPVCRGGRENWEWELFSLSDAQLSGRQNSGGDFRLVAWPEDLRAARVAVV